MRLKRASAVKPISTAMTDAELAKLRQIADGRVVLEIGSLRGASTVAVAQVASHVYSVDPHVPTVKPDGTKKTTLAGLTQNLLDHDVFEKVTVHVGWSWDIVPLYPAGFFDVAFVDAAHQYEPVVRDISLVRRAVRTGGLLAFHDYGVAGTDSRGRWEPFGVTEAVNEFAASVGQTVAAVDTLAVVRNG